ncbi:hypothetical protein FHY18_000547 [Xanthomonas arboricola]|uniref:hypothetical protein n=1 Tax=Xanthomonas sp. 3793 TaxID=3035312 RepID=UPI002167C99B|nr:hypothetical protein [Xanthomonas sp. 3793]MCS3745017.1 hypothetical protein [Xanthomonas sp. 3793]
MSARPAYLGNTAPPRLMAARNSCSRWRVGHDSHRILHNELETQLHCVVLL